MKESGKTMENKLEDKEFMDRLVDAVALNVEKLLGDPEFFRQLEFDRARFADTKLVIERIRKMEKLDGLKLPADVQNVIRFTAWKDFGLSIEDTYKVLSIFYSQI